MALLKKGHLPDEVFIAFVDDELPADARKETLAHLSDCAKCATTTFKMMAASEDFPVEEWRKRAPEFAARLKQMIEHRKEAR